MNEFNKTACIQAALTVIGDKWSPLILREIIDNDALRFSDIESSLSGLSPRTLSQRLERLEELGVIYRDQYCPAPVRCQYRATEKGKELAGIFNAMALWGQKYA